MVEFNVVELPPADHPTEGETAPDFTRPLVNDEYWEDASLSEVVGPEPTLLVFHPMDGAFPATYLYNEIRDRGWETEFTVVGVSISTPYEHKTFIEDRGIDSRLFSDPANGIAEAYGIAHDLDGMAGIEEPRPAVFLLDADRTIEYAWVASEWPEFPDSGEIERPLDRIV